MNEFEKIKVEYVKSLIDEKFFKDEIEIIL
jgi:hypothetical protein